ncbi:hypothetical protein P9112_007882 [Eukaryota sp. TZLM1-RC]
MCGIYSPGFVLELFAKDFYGVSREHKIAFGQSKASSTGLSFLDNTWETFEELVECSTYYNDVIYIDEYTVSGEDVCHNVLKYYRNVLEAESCTFEHDNFSKNAEGGLLSVHFCNFQLSKGFGKSRVLIKLASERKTSPSEIFR